MIVTDRLNAARSEPERENEKETARSAAVTGVAFIAIAKKMNFTGCSRE